MIQIDDSGSGSLIGGTCIGAMRVETGEFAYDFIPIKYYKAQEFKNKKYLKVASKITLSLLKELNHIPEEEIHVCQGYMFDEVRKVLKKKNMSVISTRIENPLQDFIEEAFQDYALSLGLPPQYVKYTKYPLHFHRILRWVYADYQKRVPLCKTGWKSWNRYGNLNINVRDDIVYSSSYFCLRCGYGIPKGSKVKRLEYVSNCPNVIYIHKSC